MEFSNNLIKKKKTYYVVSKTGDIIHVLDCWNDNTAQIEMKLYMNRYNKVKGFKTEVEMMSREELRERFGI